MDISNEATIVKDKESLDKLSLKLDYVKYLVYFCTTFGLLWTFIITFFPDDTIIQKQKMHRLKLMIFNKHWVMMFISMIIINIFVNVIKVDTNNDTEQKDLIKLQQAVLIGSVLFLTSFLSNLGYTVSLFFMGFAVWYIFKINILSPAPQAKTS